MTEPGGDKADPLLRVHVQERRLILGRGLRGTSVQHVEVVLVGQAVHFEAMCWDLSPAALQLGSVRLAWEVAAVLLF